jgi:hypothetical protein
MRASMRRDTFEEFPREKSLNFRSDALIWRVVGALKVHEFRAK